MFRSLNLVKQARYSYGYFTPDFNLSNEIVTWTKAIAKKTVSRYQDNLQYFDMNRH